MEGLRNPVFVKGCVCRLPGGGLTESPPQRRSHTFSAMSATAIVFQPTMRGVSFDLGLNSCSLSFHPTAVVAYLTISRALALAETAQSAAWTRSFTLENPAYGRGLPHLLSSSMRPRSPCCRRGDWRSPRSILESYVGPFAAACNESSGSESSEMFPSLKDFAASDAVGNVERSPSAMKKVDELLAIVLDASGCSAIQQTGVLDRLNSVRAISIQRAHLDRSSAGYSRLTGANRRSIQNNATFRLTLLV